MKMKARKGVTPVVATALLLTIAVGSVVSAGIFMDDTLEDMSGAFKDNVDEGTSKAEIDIDSAVKASDDPDDIMIVVRNTGDDPLDLEKGSGLTVIAGDEGQLSRSGGEWSFEDGKPDIFTTGQTETLRIDNMYPGAGGSVEITINGPRGVEAGLICYGGGEEC
jgi:hypothetical protein